MMHRRNSSSVGGWRRAVIVMALTAVVCLVGGFATAQEGPAVEPTPAATPTPAPTPIPVAEISESAAATAAMLRGAIQDSQIGDQVEVIEREFESERAHVDELAIETSQRLEIDGPASVLEETQKAWKRVEARIDRWQVTLKERAGKIDAALGAITARKDIWQLTLSAADEVELPPEVRQQVVAILQAIGDADRSVRANRDAVLTLQSRLSRLKSEVDDTLAQLQEEITRRRRGIVGIDSPELWNAFVVPGVDGSPSEQISAMWAKNSSTIREYVAEQTWHVTRHALCVIGFTIGLIFLRRKAEFWAQQDRSLDTTVRILDRPFSASLIMTVLLGDLLHPGAPAAWLDVLGLALLFALLRVLPLMVPKTLLPVAYVLALLYFLEEATRLAPDGNLIDRLLLLALSVIATTACWWVDRKLTDHRMIESDSWRAAVKIGIRFALAAFAVASVANIIGAVGFATLVIEGTLTSVFMAVLTWVAAVLLRAVVRVVLLTRFAKRFGLVRLHSDAVLTTVFKLITWVAVLTWVIWTLEESDAFAPVQNWLKNALNTAISFGEFSMVPGTVLLFCFLIWLTYTLSRLIQFGLETDVLPRMDLPRGVPGAITRLTHYVVMVVGVMVAVTAAGLDFSRMSFIIGALGVGIGFGLQNVVNNFVSGLILLFERPVRIGDRVQLTTLSGIVTSIGMRASIIRTWQGAEVIVPNANLISSEVINWTLSDESHRMEISVGVAYGTDPQTVIDLLVSVAEGHPDVFRDPEPVALFLGFGESSLDFELRAWSGGEFVRVASDLRVAVYTALVNAGIEIPFPQRDVHLRSADQGLFGVGVHAPRGVEANDAGIEPEGLDSSREKDGPGG